MDNESRNSEKIAEIVDTDRSRRKAYAYRALTRCPWPFNSHLRGVPGRGISRLFAGPPALDEEAEGLSFGFFTPARCSGGVPDIRQQCLGGVDALLGAGLRVVHHGEQELSGVGEFAAQG